MEDGGGRGPARKKQGKGGTEREGEGQRCKLVLPTQENFPIKLRGLSYGCVRLQTAAGNGSLGSHSNAGDVYSHVCLTWPRICSAPATCGGLAISCTVQA